MSAMYFFLQGAFDYCATLGGVLPASDFFDIYNIGETPRSSTPNNTETAEPAKEANPEPEYYDYYSEPEEIDTGVAFVDQNGVEKSRRNRVKRQSSGFWYWLNNFNDGRTCYAALPGEEE